MTFKDIWKFTLPFLNTHWRLRGGGGVGSLRWHNNIYRHSQLQKCTDKLSRGWEPSDDLHFCIERFTVLHRSFFKLLSIQTKALCYIKVVWVNKQRKVNKSYLTNKKIREREKNKINSSRLQSWCFSPLLQAAHLSGGRAWNFFMSSLLFFSRKGPVWLNSTKDTLSKRGASNLHSLIIVKRVIHVLIQSYRVIWKQKN